jgi:hypothetical protein
MSDLICPCEKNGPLIIMPYKMPINYNPHSNSDFQLLQDYFPTIANWLQKENEDLTSVERTQWTKRPINCSGERCFF